MYGPVVAVDWVSRANALLDTDAGDPELLAARSLEVVPDGFAIGAPEFVAGDFHFHGAVVHEFHADAIGADRPDAIDLVPGAFVAVHDQSRVCGGKLEMV